MKWLDVAHEYQTNAVEFLLGHSEAMLAADPGLGKTSMVLASLVTLGEKALIIAPRHVVYNVWPREIEKWAEFHGLSYTILHGPKKVDRLREDTDLYLINYEGIPWLVDQWERGRFEVPKVLVLDESTKVKHSGTARFKKLKKLVGKFERRWALTGTPMPNGLHDLFGQFYLLDLGKRLGPFVTRFRNEFFYPSGYGGYTWVPQPDAEEKIHDRVSDITLRLGDDLIDMPEMIEIDQVVTLTDHEFKPYAQMEADFVAALEAGEVEAGTASAKSSKLRQIANGAVYTHEDPTKPKTWAHVHDAKLDALDAILSEREGQQTLVAYEFIHDAERILAWARKRKLVTEVVGGGVSPKQATAALNGWNAGDLDLLIAHPGSIGHGVNLQAGGNTVVWFGPPYNLEHYDQLNRRVHRQGQKSRHTFVFRIVAEDTLDPVVARVLEGKDREQSALLNALNTHYEVTPK